MDDCSDRASTLTLAGVLILIGFFFLARNLLDFDLGHWNWWALFILIPAVGSLTNGWRIYQTAGRLSADARGPLVFGVGLLLVFAILLFDLSWGTMWPSFLIIAGVGALIVR